MKQTFTDFSQLSKAMIKPAPKAEAQKSAPSKESAPPAAETPEQTIAALRAQLKTLEAQYNAKRRECARLLAHLALSEQEVESLKGECGRLKGEAKKAAHAKTTATEEKRAAFFDALLAVNPSSGELERRRTELKQCTKDWGYSTDPKCIEKLGFKLVS